MKRCPVCNATFDDPYLSFCPNDGTPLVRMSPDEAHTVLMSTARETDPASRHPRPLRVCQPLRNLIAGPTTLQRNGRHHRLRRSGGGLRSSKPSRVLH